jgi:predicted DNA-binding ribbon-helix-helix protein
MNPQLSPNTYEQDYYLWLEETARFLRSKQFQNLDVENLIEEILDLGKSQKQALKSNLRILLMHLLKWKYQSDKRSNSWSFTILEHRIRLDDAFADSPSLKGYFEEVFEECYQKARNLASKETGLPLKTFPENNPFPPSQILDFDYLPDN